MNKPPSRESLRLPKPYYDDGRGIIIYHGDCREILPQLQKVDLVLTDPPYGINYSIVGWGKETAKVKKTFTKADLVVGDDKPFDPAHLLKLDGKKIIWGGNNFSSKLPDSRGWLIWDKKDGYGEKCKFSDCEIAWTNIDMPIRLYHHRFLGYQKASERGQKRVHPTQKPIILMSWCIQIAKDVASLIDPYLGGGSSLIAAKNLGVKAIGIEIEEKYCEIAARRLQQEILL